LQLQAISRSPWQVAALRAEFCHEGRVAAFYKLIEKSCFRAVASG
jgi:hypothetical protein